MKKLTLILLTFGILTSSTSAWADAGETYQAGIQLSIQRILENLNHPGVTPGAVIASPSQHEPNYFFHWTRDAGLVMLTLTSQAERYPQVRIPVQNWSRFEKFTQAQALKTPGSSLGEPKFMVNGQPFTGPWGRPQNDGPAIRTLAMLSAFHKFDPYVEADISYLLQNWQLPNFDLWEEVKGHHFFTLYSQMTALRYAAVHYESQMRPQNAQALHRESMKIETQLQKFVDRSRNLVVPTLAGSEGIAKPAGLDISVILALNYFGPNMRPGNSQPAFWSYTQPFILNTAKQLTDTFARIYEINKRFNNMAPGIGRYPEDVYDGNGFGGGNPWYLATYGMAEFNCAVVLENLQRGQINTDPLSQAFYAKFSPNGLARVGRLTSASQQYWTTLQGLMNYAESFIERANFHAGNDGHISEQFDRNSGYRRGAADLTWSYASKIRALSRCEQARSELSRSFQRQGRR